MRLYELSAHIQNMQCLSAHMHTNTHPYMCVNGIGAMHEWDWWFYDNKLYFMHNGKCKQEM